MITRRTSPVHQSRTKKALVACQPSFFVFFFFFFSSLSTPLFLPNIVFLSCCLSFSLWLGSILRFPFIPPSFHPSFPIPPADSLPLRHIRGRPTQLHRVPTPVATATKIAQQGAKAKKESHFHPPATNKKSAPPIICHFPPSPLPILLHSPIHSHTHFSISTATATFPGIDSTLSYCCRCVAFVIAHHPSWLRLIPSLSRSVLPCLINLILLVFM